MIVEGYPSRIGQVAHISRRDLPGRGRGTPLLVLLLLGELQHPELQSPDHRLGTVGDPELGYYVLDVALDGAPAYKQLVADLAVGATQLHEPQHLQLARRERTDG